MARPATAAVTLLTGEREPVRVATTANITLQGLQTIDGVVLAAGDRVLAKNQTDKRTNGIYTASEGPWYRASDARSSRTLQKGTTVAVQEGTVNASSVYSFQTVNPNIGTDEIVLNFYRSDDISEIGENLQELLDAPARVEAARDQILGIDPALGGEILNPWEYARPALPGMPKYAFTEPLSFLNGVLQWRDASGNPYMPTAAAIRRQVEALAYNGVTDIVPGYTDFLGYRFHRAPVSQWTDVGTGTAHHDWHDGQPAHVEDADVTKEYYDACNALGLRKWASLSRQGDTNLILDITTVNLGGSDPMTGGMTVQQRVNQACERARELAYHLTQTYGAFDGFYIGHELDHVATVTAFMQQMMSTATGSSAFPPLTSYGAKIMVAMSSPVDFANTPAIVNAIASWGVDVVVEQGGLGAGTADPSGSLLVYTYIPQLTLTETAARSALFADVIDAAELVAGHTIESVWNVEAWRMGFTPSVAITLSALNGASVTVTAASPVFDAGWVNWTLQGIGGGQAKVTTVNSSTSLTVNADYGDGTHGSFTDTTLAAGEWSISAGYTDSEAWPMGWPLMAAEIANVDAGVDSVVIYGTDAYVSFPNQTEFPAESSRGVTDYQTRAKQAGADWSAAYDAALAAKLLPGWTDPLAKFTVGWANVTGKPNSIAGYGILDAYPEPSRQSFTPSFSFATPGNLAVTYSVQKGYYVDEGDYRTAVGRIVTSSFTHTTASGLLRVYLPSVPAGDTDIYEAGTVFMAGWTKAGYTHLAAMAFPGFSYMSVYASGSGQAAASLSASDMPSGGTVTIIYKVRYRRA